MKVCIEQVEGGFSVYDEGAAMPPAADNPLGGQNPAQAKQGGQTVATVDEALQLARNMLDPEGAGDEQAAGKADADADALFSAGFNQTRGIPLNR